MDCIFCKIISGDIPAKKVYENDDVVAFHDLNPEAPTHVLIIPRKHIAMVAEMESADGPAVGKLFLAAQKIAAELGISDSGYRMVINNGPDAQQTVFHLHLHLLGGRKFKWPPG